MEQSPWWGGFLERMVGTVKRCVRKVLGYAKLSFDELNTTLIKIEDTLNARPLAYIYEESDYTVLSTYHLIFGRRLSSLADHNVNVNDETIHQNVSGMNKRFMYLIKKLDHFWNRWRREYVTDIREIHKSKAKGQSIIKEGDMVMVEEDKVKRSMWKLGKVEKLIKGKDGEVRGATVRQCSKGRTEYLNRPIQKLYQVEVRAKVAEVNEEHGLRDTSDRNVKEKEKDNLDGERKRPVRAAAADAEWKTRLVLDSS